MKSTYDDFGRVIANDRKGTAGDMTFAYDNLHGWLTRSTSASGFEQTLWRETGADNPRWNGSISAMMWEVGDGKKHTYQYTYDGLNRLTEAVYSSPKSLREILEGQNGTAQPPVFGEKDPKALIPIRSLEGNYSESYSYDKNSNIEWLQRNGTTNTGKGKTIDVLEYNYSGNQLKSVTDYSEEELNYAGAFDFQDKADAAQEYSYNENGAMTKDLNKGITNIEYDLLGTPQKVTFSDKNSIEYVYAADGRKLKTVHITAKKISLGMKFYYSYLRDTTDYINNYVFKNGKPEMYRFPGGYYSFDDKGNMDGCHFYVQDYQGNNRMVVNAYTNEVEQINHYYPYGALMGDISTNPDEQKYKYGGKELDRIYGLDLHDFEARQQDPLASRFTGIDPMAEKYYWLSPYAYCAGDPINLVDPTGKDTYTINSEGVVTVVRNDDPNTLVGTDKDGNEQTVSLDDDQAAMLDGIAVSPDEVETIQEGEEQTISSSNESIVDLFFCVSDLSNVEWGLYGYTNGNYKLKTNHQSSSVQRGKSEKDNQLWLDMHGHPEVGEQEGGTKGGSTQDCAIFDCYQKDLKSSDLMYLAFVYHKQSKMTYRYNSSSKGSTPYYSSTNFRKAISLLKNMYNNRK